MKTTWKTMVSAAALLVLPATLQASQPVAVSSQGEQMSGETTINVNQNIVTISGRASIGMLIGEANEYVYNSATGAKESHLEWQMDSLAVLGLGGSITPTHWLKLNADVVLNLSEGSGEMDDYDWVVEGYDWTHWSHHEDMEVDTVAMWDVNAEFNMFKTSTSRFFGIAGYKHDNFQWSAYGGEYIYSNYGFRDTTGAFPEGQQVISYEQTYDAPYIGIGFEAETQKVSFGGRFIYTSLAELEAVDNHYLRDLEFTDDIDEVDLIGFNLNATYKFNSNLRLMGSYSFQSYDEAKGPTTIRDLTSGATAYYGGDSGGADNQVSLFMATLAYDF